MASHRSPRGAQANDPDRATHVRVVPSTGVRRLAPPPVVGNPGRVTVAAVAAGAVVAAGQSLVSAFLPAEAPVASALLPVAAVSHLPAEAGTYAVEAVGGDQLLPAGLDAGTLDPGPAVDIQNLTKAADIGRQIAKEASLLRDALADGATEAHLFGNQVIVRPVVGDLTSGFGARWGVTHFGIDIANSIGTPIHALMGGTVEEAGPASGFGLWVVLRHDDGTKSVYGHVNRMFVEAGQEVRAGQQIAEVGNRGQSTGPHLHLEVWDAEGAKLNPLPWLQKRGITF